MKLNALQLRLHDARSYKSGFLAATLGAVTIAAVNCNGLTPTQYTTKPIWPTRGWQMSTPEAQGMDSANLAGLVDFGRKHSLDSLLIDTTASLKFSGPIGFDGHYHNGELVYHGFSDRFEGSPRVTAAKGTWQGVNTLLIRRLELGQGEPAERWTLMFFGEKLTLLAQFPDDPEILIEGQTGE